MKNANPSEWWHKTKVLAGIKVKDNLSSLTNSYDNNCKLLANDINKIFQSFTNEVQPLDKTIIPFKVDKIPSQYIISVQQVENEMAKVKLDKSSGPDNIPNWVVRDLAPVLAPAVTAIFNASLRDGFIPPEWKCANITPIPKVNIPENIEIDLRPISLTPVLSKILESFIVSWIWDLVKDKIHRNQFGGIKNSSTAHALVTMLHQWNTAIHDNKSVRVVLLDYKKAFDRVDHTILINKIKRFGIPEFITRWLCSFLADRHIRVKINSEISDWLSINGATRFKTRTTIICNNDR